MDMQKIGSFLCQLRKEQGMTQEQLGQRLGVSNKTVSRWETGTYLPPVEMLQQFSQLYGLTINEILSGQRLDDAQYREKAEENIKTTLRTSSFTMKEKIDFFKRKWKKEHLFETVLFVIALIAAYLIVCSVSAEDITPLLPLAAVVFTVARHNLMMAYVEGKVYDEPKESGDVEEKKRNRDILLRRMRIAAMVILAFLIWVTVDLAYNYFYSQVPELNDGLTVRGVLAVWIFDEDQWSRAAFFRAFITAFYLMGGAAVWNLILACVEKRKIK